MSHLISLMGFIFSVGNIRWLGWSAEWMDCYCVDRVITMLVGLLLCWQVCYYVGSVSNTCYWSSTSARKSDINVQILGSSNIRLNFFSDLLLNDFSQMFKYVVGVITMSAGILPCLAGFSKYWQFYRIFSRK